MDETEVKGLVEKSIEDEFDKLRMRIVDDLREIVGPGKISPEEAAPLLGVSYSTVYRWLGCPFSKLYLPPIDQVPDIAAFIGRVNEIREAWKDILVGWRADFNSDVKRACYHSQLLAIIEGDDPIEGKIRRLTKKTIAALAHELEVKKGSVK